MNIILIYFYKLYKEYNQMFKVSFYFFLNILQRKFNFCLNVYFTIEYTHCMLFKNYLLSN